MAPEVRRQIVGRQSRIGSDRGSIRARFKRLGALLARMDGPALTGLTVVADVVLPLTYFSVLRASGVDSSLLGSVSDWTSPLRDPGPWLFVAVAPLVMAGLGSYRDRSEMLGPSLSRLGRLAVAAAVTSWLVSILAGAFASPIPLRELAVVSLAMPFLWSLNRTVLGVLSRTAPERVVVLGSGLVAKRVMAQAQAARQAVIGWVDDDPFHMDDADPSDLGSMEQLPEILVQHRVDRVLVAFSTWGDEDLVNVLRDCDACGVDVDVVPRLFEYLGTESRVGMLGNLPILHVRAQRAKVFARAVKRVSDVVLALALLVLALPVMLAVAVAVVADTGFPVIYRQRRVGRFGKEFDIWKFRTMNHQADEQGLERIAGLRTGSMSVQDAVTALKPEEADPRVTRTGAFLRRSSLDELPQLWNVLRGDMSLVGPRPLRSFEVEALTTWQLERQSVRPGITGLWQVLGRSSVAWDQRMQLDYTYARHWTPGSDLKILAQTLPAVMRRHGAR